MIVVELSLDSIAVEIDDSAQTVVLAEVPADLEQVGIHSGCTCTRIDGQPAYQFFAEAAERQEALSYGEWEFIVGDRRIRLLLVFKEDVAASVSAIEHPVIDTVAEPEAAPDANIDAPWRDPRPVFQNLPEYPVGDPRHKRERRPNYTAIQNWEGWGREKDPPKEWWMR
jgi:hypothetical protein